MTAHPLDPLSEAEFRHVRSILARERGVGAGWRIASVELREPAKQVVRGHRPGDPVTREARTVLWDTRDGTVYTALLSLTDDALLAWDVQPGRQPNGTVDEWDDCDEAMRSHPDVAAALAGRGVTDMTLVLVDVWTYGAHLIPERHAGRRIGWCDVWVRESATSNPYAHPVSGLKLIVDLNSMELLEIEDTSDAGFPPVQGEYTPEHVPGFQAEDRPQAPGDRAARRTVVRPRRARAALAELECSTRVHRSRRPGAAPDQLRRPLGGAPPVLRRDGGALPRPDARPRAAHRLRHRGVGPGVMTTSLELGCDCLGEIRYLDAVVHDSAGEPRTIDNAICVHEEDNAVLWKHIDGRSGAEVRRMRRLVVSAHVTVANYEYLVYWRFYEDAGIECEVRATGILVTTPFEGDTPPPFGTVVDVRTYAPIHQHFIVARLDMEVDGPENTVVMSETAQLPIGPDDPHGLGLTQRSVPLRTEAEGKQDFCWETQRGWKITNPGRLNAVGSPVAYKLVPGAAVPPMLDRSSPVFRRAQVLGHTLWVTPYHPEERWPCGEFVNQSATDEGLPVWTGADRSIENTDVVLWYVFGIHHVPRVEDWPVMPADTVSFWLKPTGFFDHNPALDVAPADHHRPSRRALDG